MKIRKIISTLCAIAMSLSVFSGLTAFADGAAAKVGDTSYATLDAALAAAKDGDVVTLTADVDVDHNITITTNLTIDGNGHTVNSTGTRSFLINTADLEVTFKNLTLKSGERAIQAGGTNITGDTINIENCRVEAKDFAIITFNAYTTINVINSTVYQYGQTYTLNGSSVEVRAIDIENSNVTLNIKENSTIESVNRQPIRLPRTGLSNVNIAIDSSTLIGGYGALWLEGDNLNVDITNSTLDGNNIYPRATHGDYTDNDFETVHIGATNSTINITDTVINAIEKNTAKQYAFGFLGSNNTVNITGDKSKVVLSDNKNLTYYPVSDDKFIISGGTYPVDVTEYLADGYTVTQDENGNYVVADNTVAKIGDVKYETLDAAIKAAKDGDVVELLQDISVTSAIEISENSNIILNMNGHTITATLSRMIGAIANYGTLTINGEDANGNKGKIVSNRVGIATYKDTNLTASNIEIEATYYAVCGNGSDTNVKISLDNISITTQATGIFNPQDGTTTVKNSAISAPCGIEVRAGNVTIENCDITETNGSDGLQTSPSGSGNSVYGSTIAISQHLTNKEINVTVNGGTYYSASNYAIYEERLMQNTNAPIAINILDGTFTGKVKSQNVDKFISGGTFNTDVTEYLADGYTVEQDENGNYVVTADVVKATFTTADDFEATVAEDGTKTGTLRFLAKVEYTGAENSGNYGFMLVNLSGATVPSTHDGATESVTGSIRNENVGTDIKSDNVYHYDITKIPEVKDGITLVGTGFYAVPYITLNGSYFWGTPFQGTIDWNKTADAE